MELERSNHFRIWWFQCSSLTIFRREKIKILPIDELGVVRGEKTRRRIGLIVPSSDTVIESDFYRNLSENVTLHTARMYMESITVEGEKKMLKEEVEGAAKRIGSVKPEVVIFGCTSASALYGIEGEKKLVRRIEKITNCPCITVTAAAIQEIKRRKITKLMLLTPYVKEIYERLRDTFVEASVPVVYVAGMGYDSDFDIGNIEPEEIKKFTLSHLKMKNVDGVFLSCTTLRAMEVAKELEKETKVIVVTSNSAALNAVLRFMKLT